MFKTFEQLDAQVPLDIRVELIRRSYQLRREIKEDLEAIPGLMDYVDSKFPIDEEFEQRLEEYAKRRV